MADSVTERSLVCRGIFDLLSGNSLIFLRVSASESEWKGLSEEDEVALVNYRSIPITDIASQPFERNLY